MQIITISRGSLSGGRDLAECLAERLGYRCVAQEILHQAARKLGATEEVLRAKFETTPGLWARLHRERERYVLAVQTALAEACLASDLVYHGLAGQFLLRGLPGVFRVRLVAPLEKRIQALTDSHHRLNREAAVEFIRSVDEDRRRWVKVTYGEDVEDPMLYDLTVNLRALSLDAACAAIAEAAGGEAFRATEDSRAALEAFIARCHQGLRALAVEG